MWPFCNSCGLTNAITDPTRVIVKSLKLLRGLIGYRPGFLNCTCMQSLNAIFKGKGDPRPLLMKRVKAQRPSIWPLSQDRPNSHLRLSSVCPAGGTCFCCPHWEPSQSQFFTGLPREQERLPYKRRPAFSFGTTSLKLCTHLAHSWLCPRPELAKATSL